MKCLRLILHQNQANYRREDTMTNRMTYPLPPLSTVIGAIHNACNWKKYHDMDIGILGHYDSLNLRHYTNVIQLNTLNDDRGKLVKFSNENIQSNSYVLVAAALNNKSSFKNKKDIDIINNKEFDRFIELKELEINLKNTKNETLDKIDTIKKQKNKELLSLEKGSEQYKKIKNEIKELTDQIKIIKDNFIDQKESISKELQLYKTIISGPQFYENLSNITLFIYIRTSDDNINEIVSNIGNLKSIGRSEDTINDIKIDIIDVNNITEKIKCNSKYNSYIDYNLLKNEVILTSSKQVDAESDTLYCSVYYIPKKYVIENDKRIFERKKVIYLSNYSCKMDNENVYYDVYNNEKLLINFI